ncbi:MAG: hypothetical protein ABII96_02475 [Candidatus Zixiibacteriota bacterium]
MVENFKSIPIRFDPFLYLLDDIINLTDKHRDIGVVETAFWRWNAIIFNVWPDMFVMRIRTLQCQIIRVGLGIVPVQLFFALPSFITILVYHSWHAVIKDPFPDD